MRRRDILRTGAGAVAGLPSLAAAQSKAKSLRIGWVVASSEASTAPFLSAFRSGLADLGYVEGRNCTIEARYGDDKPEQVPALADELVRLPVDLFMTRGVATWSVVGLKSTIPVVYVFSADPVQAGFAQSFARPGGNSTGITLMSVELNGKRLELLRDILPALRQVAIIANPDHRGEKLERRQSEETAGRLGVTIQYLPAHNVAELEQALAAVASGPSQAIVNFPDPLTIQNRQRIVDFATSRRIPVVSGWSTVAQSGALFTYGPRLVESYRRAAYYVDRIAKGDTPANLPIERPTEFELVINMKTARALDIAMPASLLARADELIE